jgi:hypothetical protein
MSERHPCAERIVSPNADPLPLMNAMKFSVRGEIEAATSEGRPTITPILWGLCSTAIVLSLWQPWTATAAGRQAVGKHVGRPTLQPL